MKITMLCSTKTNLNAGNCILLYSVLLYDESCYMKTVVTISLVHYKNSRCRNSLYTGVNCISNYV